MGILGTPFAPLLDQLPSDRRDALETDLLRRFAGYGARSRSMRSMRHRTDKQVHRRALRALTLRRLVRATCRSSKTAVQLALPRLRAWGASSHSARAWGICARSYGTT